MDVLVEKKVYYKIFDLSCKMSTYVYCKRHMDLEIQENIQNNRRCVMNYHQAKNIAFLKQIHGKDIIDADLITNYETDEEGDGIVTTKTDLVLAIETADCVPILLSSAEGNVIGAGHCGWRGAKAGIVDNLVQSMRKKKAEDICAVIGPSIQQCFYEVNRNIYESFIKLNPANSRFFLSSTKQEHFMFDLPGCVELELFKSGVRDIKKLQEDTYNTKLEDSTYKYPSYRRSCHKGEPLNKFLLSTIVIKGNYCF